MGLHDSLLAVTRSFGDSTADVIAASVICALLVATTAWMFFRGTRHSGQH